VRRPYQQERQAGRIGEKMQPLARFQIQLVDEARDGRRRARMKRLFDRPQGVFAMGGFDQDKMRRIEAERVQSVAKKAAVGTQPVCWQDENNLFPPSSWGRVERGLARRWEIVDACVKPLDPHP
jgi:hypothetical protein